MVQDYTSSTWVSFFNEQAEPLLGNVTADQVFSNTYGGDDAMTGGANQDYYDSVFARARYSEWIFKCKVKNEMVNDEQRLKTSVFALQPVDYLKESKDLLTMIEKF
jgi:replication factor A1